MRGDELMGVAKPVLGYPSRSAAAKALRDQGRSWNEVGQQIGVTAKIARTLAHGVTRKRESTIETAIGISPEAAVKALIPYHMRESFRDHAARRGVSQARLIQTILDKVIEDDLVDAVLDDMGERA